MPSMLRCAALSCALALFSLGCAAPSPASDAGDAASEASARRDAGRTCPPPNNACLVGCGNEVGVGMPCTRGGGECMVNGFSNAFLCTADFVDDPNELAFCTRACSVDTQCGTAARCAGDPNNASAGRGCFPRSCDGPEPDAGASDASNADASHSDANNSDANNG
jgi:hypothetical protein